MVCLWNIGSRSEYGDLSDDSRAVQLKLGSRSVRIRERADQHFESLFRCRLEILSAVRFM